MKRVLLFAALALMACPSTTKCDSNDDCPSGQTCSVQSGVCQTATTGGGTGTTGGGSATTGGGVGTTGGGTTTTGGGTTTTGGGTATTGGGTGTTGGGTTTTGGGDGTTGGGTATTGGGTGTTGGGTAQVAGDTCASALSLVVGTMTNQTVDDASDDYNGNTSNSCYAYSGPDKAYAITIPAGQRLSVTLTVTSGDLDAVLQLTEASAMCGTECVANADDGLDGDPETLLFANTSSADADYYFVVDSYSGTGTFTLTTTLASPQPGDTCDGNEDALVTGMPATQQSLDPYFNDYDYNVSLGDNCSFGTSPDRVYQVLVPAGAGLQVVAVPDGDLDLALNLVDSAASCGDVCVANADTGFSGGETETLQAVNTTGADHTYLIIVDAWGGSGTFTLTATTFTPAADDACSGATGLDAGTLSAQTLTGYFDNYNQADTQTCTFGSGPDRAYSVSVPAGQRGVVTVTPLASTSASAPTVNLIAGSAPAVCEASPVACVSSTNAQNSASFVNTSGTDAALFAIVDGVATDAFDVAFSTAVPPTDDTCTTAMTVLPTDGGSVAGTLDTFFGDYGAGGDQCIRAEGVDRVYRLSVPGNQRVALTLTDDADAGLATVMNVITSTAADCESATTRVCQPASNDYNSSAFSNSTGTARDYFVAVAQYSMADGGAPSTAFHLSAVLSPIPQGELCSAPLPLTGTAVVGTTVGFFGDTYVDSNQTTCLDVGSAPDVLYSVTVANQQTLTVNATSTDPNAIVGMNLLAGNTDCTTTVSSCLSNGYFYSGGSAPLTYTNTSGSPQSLLLQVVTAAQTGDQHRPFSLNVTLAP